MCRSVKYLSVTIKNVNKRRSILRNSHSFSYQIISFDVNLHASCFSSLNFVKFIVKFKKFEHFIFLILFYFFTGTMHVKIICYLCYACTNEICFYIYICLKINPNHVLCETKCRSNQLKLNPSALVSVRQLNRQCQ